MTEQDLRKRKKKNASSKVADTKEHEEEEPNTTEEYSVPTIIYYAAALLAGGLFVFLYPSLVVEFLDAWIGFSDGYTEYSEIVSPGVAALPTADIQKRNAVVAAFKHAWHAYERDAMGADEYHPIGRKGTNLTEAGGIGYTVVDSIDTMILMGLADEFTRARVWVKDRLSFDRDAVFNTFETTIRVLGGLLSAYQLTNDSLFLDRAVELADRMLPVFDTNSGLPLPQINLGKRMGVPDNALPALVGTAEVATLQLEFRYLSQLTGNEVYWRKVENVMSRIKESTLPHGLASIYMMVETGQFIPSTISLGSRGDSYYEYLLKQYLQTNRTENVYREMYDKAMQGIHDHLVQFSTRSHMLYTSELVPEMNQQEIITWRLTPKQDHLVCFLGGSLMLGAVTVGALEQPVSIPPRTGQLSETGKRDWDTGVQLIQTCMNTHDTATGLSPEIVYFRIPSDNLDNNPIVPQDWYIKGAQPGSFTPYDARYMLRPETIESLFLAYRLTGDFKYREFGWKIFQSIEKYCKVETGGYATVVNVDEVPVRLEDKMETFWMSETLKYLYLLFDDFGTLPLDKYIFNTEAHPLPVFAAEIPTGFS